MTAPHNRFRLPVACSALVLMFSASVGMTAAAEVPRVTGFTLINADTDQPVAGFDPIPQNATLNFAALATSRLNIRANVSTTVDSVRLVLDSGAARVERSAPYALAGNSGGDYRAWTPGVGNHAVTATATLAGSTGPPTVLHFVVVAAGPPAPPPPITPAAARCSTGPATPAGWLRRVTSNFNETTPLGGWPGSIAAPDWRNRAAGAKDSSGRGTYNSAKTVSEHHGMLDVWVHSEGATRYVAAPIPRIGDTVGQRVSICMRADRIPGYKIAFMLWPSNGPGNYHGEVNYPEGKLTPEGVGNAFMHYDPEPATGKKQDAFQTGQSTMDWHVYTTEWDPAHDTTSFYFDGRLIGRSVGARVPDGPMHYIMQIETYVGGQALPAAAEGHILVDWVTIDVPSSGSLMPGI